MLSRFASPSVSVTLSQDIVFVHALDGPFPVRFHVSICSLLSLEPH